MSETIEQRKLGRQAPASNNEASQIADARLLFPGGVLGGNALPDGCAFVFSHGQGSRFWDVSGNEYIDYVLGSGSLFLGHANPTIQKAVAEQALRATHAFPYLNETAIAYARRLQPLIRCAERMRFTTAGSDSTFHAMRLARGFTGREKIIRFEGAYHGVHDYAQLSTAPSDELPFPQANPDTAGIPAGVRELTLVAQWNDIDSVKAVLQAHGHEVAAIIMEPIQRILSPKPGFLHEVQDLARAHGCLFILDEVVTGFRYGLGGAQAYFDITPDLATYGKIIGGGLPVGAVMGRADIMEQADPAQKGRPGFVYQNGTLQGHPLGCAAGMAMLDILSEPGLYDRVFALAERLRNGLQEIFDRHRMGVVVFGEGPMWHFLFAESAPSNYRDIRRSDMKKLKLFETAMIKQGLFVLPGNRRFVSIQHTDDDLAATFDIVERCCRTVGAG